MAGLRSSFIGAMKGFSIEDLLDKARPYFPDVNISEETFESVDWSQMQGTWYEVARTDNNFQHKCGGSRLCLKEKNSYSNCSSLCYSRTFYSNGKITKQEDGTANPSAIPFAISLVPGMKNSNYYSVPNYYVIWTDYNYSIWATITGNVWIFSRTPEICDETLGNVICQIPGNFLRCRINKIEAVIPPSCCNE